MAGPSGQPPRRQAPSRLAPGMQPGAPRMQPPMPQARPAAPQRAPGAVPVVQPQHGPQVQPQYGPPVAPPQYGIAPPQGGPMPPGARMPQRGPMQPGGAPMPRRRTQTPYGMAQASPVGTNRLALTAMILGIVGCVIWIVPYVNLLSILCDILAIIFGAVGISKAKRARRGKGMAIAGLILGVVGLVMWILLIIVFAALFSAMFGRL